MMHGIVTIVTPIKDAREDTVRQRLKALCDGGLPSAPLIGLHFASLSVLGKYLDAPKDFKPQLVFEASFDGPREDFIDDLVANGSAWLDTVYRDCEGYPDRGTQLPQVVKNYLLRNDVGADCLFIAYPYRSVAQIQQERQLRDALASLDEVARSTLAHRNLPPPMQRSLVSRLRQQIAAIPALRGVLTLPERPFVVTYGPQIADMALRTLAALLFVGAAVLLNREVDAPVTLTAVLWLSGGAASLIAVWRPRWKKTAQILLLAAPIAIWLAQFERVARVLDAAARQVVALSVLLLWVIGGGIVVAILWLLVVQCYEWHDKEPPLPSWDPDHEHILRQREHRDAQNHLVGLNPIKSGFLKFRLLNLRLVLWTIHVTKYLEKSGFLSGISSIHFARWVIIDHGRQLLFLSHYDGDWDAYLGDFVEQASNGLTAVWSNCVGFPRAWFLFWGGARDQRAFKAYARRSQHETLWVYRAYPQLTVSDIENHTAIREALGRSLDAAGLEALLRRL